MSPRALAMLLTTAIAFSLAPRTATAQDRAQLAVQADALLRSASEDALDGLFVAVHGLSRSPTDAPQVCRALASAARGSTDTWLALAQGLSSDGRDALTGALTDVALPAFSGQPMPFDEAAAKRQLKQAGVRASLLHDGFSAAALGAADSTGAGDTDAAAGHQALRCQSLGWLLDAVAGQPRAERAAITRLLLREGLASTLASASAPAAAGG